MKTPRSDILRKPEIDSMLRMAENFKYSPQLRCIIALAWLFGKRVSEIVRLSREDFWWDDNFLYVRFLVLKKKTLRESAIPKYYTKRIRLEHPYTSIVIKYVSEFKEGYVFPKATQERVDKVKTKYINREGKTVTGKYKYQRIGGYMSRQLVHYYLKQINPDSWMHLFRESLATYMSERGATEEELMHWFDWDDIRTAHTYVKRGTKLTEKWSERKW